MLVDHAQPGQLVGDLVAVEGVVVAEAMPVHAEVEVGDEAALGHGRIGFHGPGAADVEFLRGGVQLNAAQAEVCDVLHLLRSRFGGVERAIADEVTAILDGLRQPGVVVGDALAHLIGEGGEADGALKAERIRQAEIGIECPVLAQPGGHEMDMVDEHGCLLGEVVGLRTAR